MKSVYLPLLLLLLSSGQTGALAQDQPKTGTIKGLVLDADTKSPIVGASILIVGTTTGAATNTSGNFTLADLPVGNYTLQFRSIGYETKSRTDVIVKSQRITFVEIELEYTAVEIGDVVVKSGYFTEEKDQPTSISSYSAEEIRRAPGSAGDVSRIMLSLPSIAKIDDQLNNLVVRGGNPGENSFYLDNIEIPNINHYPIQGSSGGPIGLLNNDFIQDATFSAGGFPALYGDRLSSVMDLTFREGNREEFDGQLELHFAGVGFVAEGPLAKPRGSWMLSVRRSFLDLLVDAIGTGVAPKYSDYQGKAVYDLAPGHTLTTLGVLGVDYIEFEKDQSVEDDNVVYGTYDGLEYALGATWRYLWGTGGYSLTSVSTFGSGVDGMFFETKSNLALIEEDTREQTLQLRNVNHCRYNESHAIDFGIEAKQIANDYDYASPEYTNVLGDTVPALVVDDYITSSKAAVFASYIWRPWPRLTSTWGVRYDYFSFNRHGHVSPRFSSSYALTDRMAINAAAGIYYQSLPLILISQRAAYKDLKDPLAWHTVLGTDYLLTANTKLTIEGYYKSYSNFPLDPAQPQLFVVDGLAYGYYIGNFEQLRDEGKAESYGIELTVRKKLVAGVYGLLGGSYSVSRYRGLDGVWRDRMFDNRLILSAEGGYKPNEKWEFSLRWIFGGGPPYTPLDLEASQLINRSVLDRNRVNVERYPDYHSLNVRVDRRFHFGGSNLTMFFSAWNVYNRKNISTYYWNEIEQQQDTIYQWSLLPVIGLEFEF